MTEDPSFRGQGQVETVTWSRSAGTETVKSRFSLIFFLLDGRIQIRIILSTSKNIKNNHDFYSFVLLLNNLISLKTDVNVPTVSNKQINFGKKGFNVGILKVTE